MFGATEIYFGTKVKIDKRLRDEILKRITGLLDPLSAHRQSVLKSYTFILNRLAQFVRMHTHIPESSNTQDVALNIIYQFIVIVDNK